MSKKGLLIFAVLAITTLILSACGGAAATPTPEQAAGGEAATEAPAAAGGSTVTLWFHSGRGAERDALTEILGNFADAHPEITVDAVELPEGDYNQQVQAAAVANDLPCLLDFDGPFLYNYAWGGFLTPLDDYVSADMKSDFLPSIIDQGTYQDHLYSLGQFDSGLAIWARKSYLDAAGVRIPTLDEPWTRDEFDAALASLQALPEVEYALDLKMNYGRGEWYTYAFSPILQSFGGDLIDRSTYETAEGVLNGPESVAAMEMVQGWFQDGYVNPEPAGDTDFIDGTAALSWVGHWVAPDYIENVGDDLLLLPFPDFGKGSKTGMGSWNWGITSSCPNPDDTWTVLDFMLQPEQILIMTNANGAVPARSSAIANSELYAEGGLLRLFVQQLEGGYAVPRPITPAYPTITTAFQEAFDNIKDGSNVQDELDGAVDQIDSDLEENNFYQ
ncbi:MAG: sugar ABC transporter substrate-binding protein [Chloroflexota bacterium]